MPYLLWKSVPPVPFLLLLPRCLPEGHQFHLHVPQLLWVAVLVPLSHLRVEGPACRDLDCGLTEREQLARQPVNLRGPAEQPRNGVLWVPMYLS